MPLAHVNLNSVKLLSEAIGCIINGELATGKAVLRHVNAAVGFQDEVILNVTALKKEAWSSSMQVNLQIPDDVACRLAEAGGDLSRRALEAFALEELRAGHITETQLREMLGLGRIQLDGFLRAHGIYQDYTLEDFKAERQALKEIGL